MDNRLLPHVAADTDWLAIAGQICNSRVEPEATERELADVDVTSAVNDGGHLEVISEMDAMGALTLSERLEAISGRLDEHCKQLDAFAQDITRLSFHSV